MTAEPFILPTYENRILLRLAARGVDIEFGAYMTWRARFVRRLIDLNLPDAEWKSLIKAVEETPEVFMGEDGRLMDLEELRTQTNDVANKWQVTRNR